MPKSDELCTYSSFLFSVIKGFLRHDHNAESNSAEVLLYADNDHLSKIELQIVPSKRFPLKMMVCLIDIFKLLELLFTNFVLTFACFLGFLHATHISPIVTKISFDRARQVFETNLFLQCCFIPYIHSLQKKTAANC